MGKIDLKLLDAYVKADTRFCSEKHENDELIIYGYDGRKSINPIVWNNFNLIMRGLITDVNGNILVRSFEKFFTFNEYLSENIISCSENQIIELPKEKPLKILEKIDGSMGILYWDKGIPKIATQRSFTNPNAIRGTEILHQKYKHTFSKLKREYSYIFEVVFPETNVLVDYGDTEALYLIGILNTETGEEISITRDIGFEVPFNYAQEYGNETDLSKLQELNLKNKEGLVITYANGLKIKIKFDWYAKSHKLLNEILQLEEQLYKTIRSFKDSMGYETKKITPNDVEVFLKKGIRTIPNYYLQNGISHWAENRNVDNQEFILSLDTPSTYTPMWNFVKSIKEQLV